MTNQSFAGKRLLKSVLSIVIAIVLLITVFVNTAFADNTGKYEVTVVDGADTIAVTTTETEPVKILKGAGIILNDADKLDITGFVAEEGGIITVDRYNTIYISLAGNITEHGVYSDTVGAAFEELGYAVTADDGVNYSFDSLIRNGMVITIDKALKVNLTADGETKEYTLISGTVETLLALAGITLDEDDYTLPDTDTVLEDGAQVSVYRVTFSEETVKEAISYDTKKINDSDIEIGEDKLETAGVNGEAEVTYKVKYINGEEDSKSEISRTVTKKPVDAVLRVGTKLPEGYNSVEPNGTTSYNGYSLGDTISGRYSHYCACSLCSGNSRGITASGRKVSNGMPNPYYAACNWLPLGSVIDVDGQLYTVADRGGSGLSKKGRIDIFTPEGHSACYAYGVGSCTITIVRIGW